MSNLSDFLLARIAEDEAEGLAGGPELATYWGGIKSDLCYSDEYGTVRYECARVLAECDAKRRLVEWCCSGENSGPWESLDGVPDYREPLRILALPYADHPDYRPEWKP